MLRLLVLNTITDLYPIVSVRFQLRSFPPSVLSIKHSFLSIWLIHMQKHAMGGKSIWFGLYIAMQSAHDCRIYTGHGAWNRISHM